MSEPRLSDLGVLACFAPDEAGAALAAVVAAGADCHVLAPVAQAGGWLQAAAGLATTWVVMLGPGDVPIAGGLAAALAASDAGTSAVVAPVLIPAGGGGVAAIMPPPAPIVAADPLRRLWQAMGCDWPIGLRCAVLRTSALRRLAALFADSPPLPPAALAALVALAGSIRLAPEPLAWCGAESAAEMLPSPAELLTQAAAFRDGVAAMVGEAPTERLRARRVAELALLHRLVGAQSVARMDAAIAGLLDEPAPGEVPRPTSPAAWTRPVANSAWLALRAARPLSAFSDHP